MSRIVARFAAVLIALTGARSLAHGPSPDERELERLRQAEVVVVTGSADHMEQVMRRAKVKFVTVSPDQLPNLPLHGQQVLMVNCTGQMSEAARERVRRFVSAGGLLYATDHAVHYLLEPLFPGYVKWSGKTSVERVFPMRTSGERGLLKHLSDGNSPRWQTASGGYLFEVVDPHKVEVLMSSLEMAQFYHSSPALGVCFRVGDGQVIHVTGHFFTQPGQRPEVAAAGQAFERLSENVVSEKRQDNTRLDGIYNVSPKRAMPLLAAPEAAAPPASSVAGAPAPTTSASTRVRVLEHKGKFAKVRDVEGNEGWVDSDSL